jgi:hypothetical protein
VKIPPTRYAKSGELNIAYQVVGDGPFDLVYVPGWISNIEVMWTEPTLARLLGRLASFSRLLLFASAARASPTEFRTITCPLSSNGWTTCAP